MSLFDSQEFSYFPQYLQFAFANYYNYCKLFRTRIYTRKVT